MRISALEEYGLRCLLALAAEGPGGQLSISTIAEKEGLSVPYASKLLAILRQANLVNAVRGRGGGFCIARAPEEINLLEVMTALGGPLIDPGHCTKYSGQMEQCVHRDNCSIIYVLSGVAGYIGDYLATTSLVDLLHGDILDRVKKIQSKVTIPTLENKGDTLTEIKPTPPSGVASENKG